MVRAVCNSGVCFLLLFSVTIADDPEPTAAKPTKVDFARDVAPLLQQNCIDCHGPAMQMAELRLDQRRFVFGDDADPDLVKAGKSGECLVIRRLTESKLGLIMSPTFPLFSGEKT